MEIIKSGNIEHYTINKINDFQNEMLEILNYIVDLCEKHNLKVFLDGGTLLGCYRDNKIIPWDDDVDISLIKSDYLKLIKILKEDNNDNYYLYDENLSQHTCNYLVKKSNIFQVFKGRYRTSLMPPKVDIRPLNVHNNESENKIYRDVANYIIFNKSYYKSKDEILNIIKKFGSKNDFLHWYNVNYGIDEIESEVMLSHPYYEYTIKESFKYSDILPFKTNKFEGKDYVVPNEDFLFKCYGNYNEYPPLDERKPVANNIIILDDKKSGVINSYHHMKKNSIKISFILKLKYFYYGLVFK